MPKQAGRLSLGSTAGERTGAYKVALPCNLRPLLEPRSRPSVKNGLGSFGNRCLLDFPFPFLLFSGLLPSH